MIDQAAQSWAASVTHKATKGYGLKALISGMAFAFSLSAPCFVITFGFWYSDKLVQDGDADFKGVMMAFSGTIWVRPWGSSRGGFWAG